jgi:ABC-type bacteriocin/lantibiotic exporter with double-glycine peptidase domain
MSVQPTMQVASADCAVASLAMYPSKPYRKVSEIALTITPNVHKEGLWTEQMQLIARKLGVKLVARKAVVEDLDDATAILCVSKRHVEHAVMLFQGVVYNPADGQMWDLETWLTTHGWKVTGVLVAA